MSLLSFKIISQKTSTDSSSQKQTSRRSSLNVKWAAGDEDGPWGSLGQDETQQHKTESVLSSKQHYQKIRLDIAQLLTQDYNPH